MRPHGASTKTWGNDDVVAAGNHLKPTLINNDADLYSELPGDLNAADETKSQNEDSTSTKDSKNQDSTTALDVNMSDMDYLHSKMKPDESPLEDIKEQDSNHEVLNVHPSRLARLDETGAVNVDNIKNTFMHSDQQEDLGMNQGSLKLI